MQKHRSMAYFPVLTGRDEMSKQARFVIRMALACHEAGTPYDVQWKRHGERFAATLTATGNIPMPKPFPKPPKTRTTAQWKPNLFAEASYRTNVGLDPKGKEQSGWIVEHSSGLSLVKFGQSDTGELTADDRCEPTEGWHLTHTASLRGFCIAGKFQRMVSALCFASGLADWRKSADELAALPEFRRIGFMVEAEYGSPFRREQAKERLAAMGGPISPTSPTTPEPPPTPAAAVRTRTKPTPAVDAVSRMAANEARIAQIQSQLAGDTQARLNRLLAELRANRPKAPEGKLAVTYPDGRVAYIPDPAAERRVGA